MKMKMKRRSKGGGNYLYFSWLIWLILIQINKLSINATLSPEIVNDLSSFSFGKYNSFHNRSSYKFNLGYNKRYQSLKRFDSEQQRNYKRKKNRTVAGDIEDRYYTAIEFGRNIYEKLKGGSSTGMEIDIVASESEFDLTANANNHQILTSISNKRRQRHSKILNEKDKNNNNDEDVLVDNTSDNNKLPIVARLSNSNDHSNRNPDSDSNNGNTNPIGIEWENINCIAYRHQKHLKRQILRNVSGKALPGRMLAIMGPSGSGKTTLLSTLAGQLPCHDYLELSGEAYITCPGGNSRSTIIQGHGSFAFVKQEDLFYSQLTVKETLEFITDLRLPHMDQKARENIVMNIIQKLGLTKVMNTLVGDEKKRGISGGERKRLAIACELVGNPSKIIFADEPTSGLDSFQALNVIATLKRLCIEEGHTVIMSIHQPRSTVYQLFDDIILMSEGSVLYEGAAKTALSYFNNLGYKCPIHFNPAEFMLDVCSIDTSDKSKEIESKIRLQELVESYQQHRFEQHKKIGEQQGSFFKNFLMLNGYRDSNSSSSNNVSSSNTLSSDTDNKSSNSYVIGRDGKTNRSKLDDNVIKKRAQLLQQKKKRRSRKSRNIKALRGKSNTKIELSTFLTHGRIQKTSSRWKQIRLLLCRQWKQTTRDWFVNGVRAISTMALAALFGSIFFKLDLSEASIQERVAVIMHTCINTGMIAMVKTLNLFTKERAIVHRESTKGLYSMGPYLVSKIISEVPIDAFFPIAFGSILYPMCGFNYSFKKFGFFLGNLALQTLASTGIGLSIGALCPSTDTALALGPTLMVIFILLSGQVGTSNDKLPAFIKWGQNLSIVRWAFDSLCCNEFEGLLFTLPNKSLLASIPFFPKTVEVPGSDILNNLNMRSNATQASLAQLAILAGAYMLTYTGLKLRSPKYQPMITPTTLYRPGISANSRGKETKLSVDSDTRSTFSFPSSDFLATEKTINEKALNESSWKPAFILKELRVKNETSIKILDKSQKNISDVQNEIKSFRSLRNFKLFSKLESKSSQKQNEIVASKTNRNTNKNTNTHSMKPEKAIPNNILSRQNIAPYHERDTPIKNFSRSPFYKTLRLKSLPSPLSVLPIKFKN